MKPAQKVPSVLSHSHVNSYIQGYVSRHIGFIGIAKFNSSRIHVGGHFAIYINGITLILNHVENGSQLVNKRTRLASQKRADCEWCHGFWRVGWLQTWMSSFRHITISTQWRHKCHLIIHWNEFEFHFELGKDWLASILKHNPQPLIYNNNNNTIQ